jgi:5-(carboxyamino)imidazole ribonucleotide synthase
MKIGVLGGGQLGRMLALAGIPLGLEFVFYDNKPQACAAHLGEFMQGEFDDPQQLTRFAQAVGVVTLEFESIPPFTVDHLAQYVPVLPGNAALETAQDRLAEKQFFERLEIPVPRYYPVETAEQLAEAARRHGDALIVKSRKWGYDGKGQDKLLHPQDAASIWERLGGNPLIAEQQMPFQREISLIAVRSSSGEQRCYPLAENVHRNGILICSQPIADDPLQTQAEAYMQRVMSELDYVGVLAMEFFDCEGQLFVNEMAPRVHNSGHWSIEACVTSQFENHLRAILKLPLGDTSLRNNCVMYNCIGSMPQKEAVLRVRAAHFHDYGKQARPGRKLGHVTLCSPSPNTLDAVESLLKI